MSLWLVEYRPGEAPPIKNAIPCQGHWNCPRCHEALLWEECSACHGEGLWRTDKGEIERCEICAGHAGRYTCEGPCDEGARP